MAATEVGRRQWALRVVTSMGFATDAYVHADRAAEYDLNRDGAISQGDLFRIEAGVAALLALVLLVVANRLVWVLALLVAATALGAVILSVTVDLGRLGPLPDMYEPLWYPKKVVAAVAAAVATGASLAGLGMSVRRRVSAHPAQVAREGIRDG